jgi:hypothetical protein
MGAKHIGANRKSHPKKSLAEICFTVWLPFVAGGGDRRNIFNVLTPSRRLFARV